MAEFEFGGTRYQSRLFEDVVQWAVMKRLTPTFTAMIGIFEGMRTLFGELPTDDGAETGERLPMQAMADLVMPVSRELANLSDADLAYILRACLDVTERRGANGWMPVRDNGVVNNRADSNFAVQCAIAWHVVGSNFADMFAGFGVDLPKMMAMAKAKTSVG